MKYLLAIGFSLLFTSITLRAEESKVASKPKAAQFLEDLQTKLDHVARRANQPVAGGSAVAGLRGSKQEPISKQLYWKGKTTENSVSIDEVKLFHTGVEEARAGKTDVAIATLKSFLDKYPQSSLKPDVEETLKVLGAATPQA